MVQPGAHELMIFQLLYEIFLIGLGVMICIGIVELVSEFLEMIDEGIRRLFK